MAKKKSGKGKVDEDLDLGDLEDMDFGEMEFEDFDAATDGSRKPTATSVAKELAVEAGKSAFESTIRNAAKKALPPEYDENYYTAMEYADFAKETYDRNKQKVNKSLYKAAVEAKKLLPFQIGLLDKYIERQQSEFEQFRQESEEAIRESNIASNLAGIFDKQLEVQKVMEASRQANAGADRRQSLVATKANLDALMSIDAHVGTTSAFTTQITKEYYRKSLELQFKSYFILSDQLKVMRESYQGFSVQLDAISKNTGLPDYVKLTQAERLGELVKDKFTQGIYKRLYDNNSFVDRFKKRAGGVVDQAVGGVTGKIDDFANVLEQLNGASDGMGRSSLLINLLGGMAGDTLGGKIADKISPKLRERIKNNTAINSGGKWLEALSNSPSAVFTTMADRAKAMSEEAEGGSGVGSAVKSKLYGGLATLFGAGRDIGKAPEIRDESVLDHKSPAIFDRKAHAALSDGIPLYLSHLLAETSSLRKMYGIVNAATPGVSDVKAERLLYDPTSRTLVTSGAFVAAIEKSVFKDRSQRLSAQLKMSPMRLMRDINTDKNITNESQRQKLTSKDSQERLSKYFENAEKLGNVEIDFKTLILDYEKNQDLAKMVNEDKALKEVITQLQKSSSASSKKEFDLSVKDAQRVIPIKSLMEFTKTASRCAGSKTLNTLTEAEAETLARIFMRHTHHTGTEVSIASILNGRAFANATAADLEVDKLKEKIAILAYECKRIEAMADPMLYPQFIGALGLMSKSLNSASQYDEKAFQALRDYNNLLVDKGKLSVEQLVEGKLGVKNRKEEDYIGFSQARELTKVQKSALTKMRGSHFIDNFSKSFAEETGKYAAIKDKFAKDVDASGGSLGAILNAVKTATSDVVSTIKADAKRVYATARSAADEFARDVDKAIAKLTPGIRNKLLDSLDKVIVATNKAIEVERTSYQKEVEMLNAAREQLSIAPVSGGAEIEDKDVAARRIDKQLEYAKKAHDVKIKLLMDTVSRLGNAGKQISTFRDEDANLKAMLQGVKNVISNASASLDKSISDARTKLEEINASLAEQAP